MVCPFLIHLASRSPRRRQLLESVGFEVHVIDSRDEPPLQHKGSGPMQASAAALAKLPEVFHAPVVLSADTVVHFDGQCLGKPRDHDEAKKMLTMLSGNRHQVTTAVAMRSAEGVVSFSVTSTVVFRLLGRTEIDRYVATGEPMDKAGGYGIQGRGAGLIDGVDGSHTAVVGLPLAETLQHLAKLGVVPP